MDNTQLCYDCAFKHLAMAQAAWYEVMNGYAQSDHYLKVVGHLAHAEEHLAERHQDLSEKIRTARKAWWDATLLGAAFRPPFEELAQEVLEHAIRASSLERVVADGKEEAGPSERE